MILILAHFEKTLKFIKVQKEYRRHNLTKYGELARWLETDEMENLKRICLN